MKPWSDSSLSIIDSNDGKNYILHLILNIEELNWVLCAWVCVEEVYLWGQGLCSWPRGNSEHNLVWTWRQEAATAKLEVSARDLLTLRLWDLSTLFSLDHTQTSSHTCWETELTHTYTLKRVCANNTHTDTHTLGRQQSGVSWRDRDTLAFQQPESLDRSGPHTLMYTQIDTHTHTTQL